MKGQNLFSADQKTTNPAYRDGWDRIFGKQEKDTERVVCLLHPGLDGLSFFYPKDDNENCKAVSIPPTGISTESIVDSMVDDK